MYPTKNDIPQATRAKLVLILNQLLSDAIDLKSQAKQAHWNVKGENFIALHELFDTVSTQAESTIDLIAERIVQLGDTALGTVRVSAKQSRLKEYPLTASDGQKHVDALSSALADFNGNARKAIDETANLSDTVSSDILTEITRSLDKLLWFVESHLSEQLQSKQKKAI